MRAPSLALLLAALPFAAASGAGSQPAEGFDALPLVQGEWHSVMIETEETLLDVAYRHRAGFEAVQRLNPGVDPWIPPPGTVVRLPERFVLPDADAEGLVVNVPEMRLYDFTADRPPRIFSVAVGDPEDPTLLGDFRVGEKRTDPTWRVPKSIREEKPELPAEVPPGPDNPLGSRWLTIGTTSYGIHGTNVRWSIGRLATHGCLRLYESEVRDLYDRIPSGTRIQLIYQPYKWGREGNALMLEAHPDLYDRIDSPLSAALLVPMQLGLLGDVDLAKVYRVVREARGIPLPVGRHRPPRRGPAGPSAPATSKPTS